MQSLNLIRILWFAVGKTFNTDNAFELDDGGRQWLRLDFLISG